MKEPKHKGWIENEQHIWVWAWTLMIAKWVTKENVVFMSVAQNIDVEKLFCEFLK